MGPSMTCQTVIKLNDCHLKDQTTRGNKTNPHVGALKAHGPIIFGLFIHSRNFFKIRGHKSTKKITAYITPRVS